MPLNLNTNLLKQFMLSGGAAMSGMPWLKAIAPIGINTLQAQNMHGAIMGGGSGNGGQGLDMMSMMKYLLGGGMPGSTMKADDKGVQFTIPQNQFSKDNPNDLQPFAQGSSLGVPAPNVPTPSAEMNLPPFGLPDIMKAFMAGGGNPSVSQQGNQMPNLAGLKPSDVANALNVQTGMRSQTVKEAMQPVEMLYRGALTQQALASAKNLNIPKDQRTAAVQNYEYAVGGGYTGSFAEFVTNKGGEATSIEEWKQARSGGYEGTYYDWKKEMTALGGGLSLSEKVQQKVAMSSVKRREQLADPIAISKRIDDIVKNDSNLRAKILTGTPEESQKAKASAKINAIKQIIEEGSGGGKIVDATRSGSIITIKVKWEDGTVEEMKYDIAK